MPEDTQQNAWRNQNQMEILNTHVHPKHYPHYYPHVHHHHHGHDGHGMYVVSFTHPWEPGMEQMIQGQQMTPYSTFPQGEMHSYTAGMPYRYESQGVWEGQQEDTRLFPLFPLPYAPYWHPYYRPYGFGYGPFIRPPFFF